MRKTSSVAGMAFLAKKKIGGKFGQKMALNGLKWPKNSLKLSKNGLK